MEIIITISAAKRRHLLDEIQSIKKLIALNLTSKAIDRPVFGLTIVENQLTLHDIESCLQITNPDVLSRSLIQLLADRWENIRHSSISYVNAPLNSVNQLCLYLATELAPLPETEEEIDDLALGEGPYFLLMPSLAVHQDVFGQNIHNLRLHQFVLSDDDRLFIPLRECLTHAFESDTGHFKHVVSLDNQYPELSPSELLRVSRNSTPINEYYQAIVAFNDQRLHGDNLGVHLNALTIALRAGGAHGYRTDRTHRAGQSLDSGADANEGIVSFADYWNPLTQAQKRLYYQTHPALEDVLGRLMRPNHVDYQEVIYCVELLADALDPIITACNQIGHYTATLHARVIDKQIQLPLVAKKEHYPGALLAEIKPPKIWKKIFVLPERLQQELFQHTPHKSALLYALEHDPVALPEYAQFLSDKSKKLAIKARFTNNESALIFAAAQSDGSAAVEILLGLGADIEAVTCGKRTALGVAGLSGHGAVMITLLNRGADINRCGANILATTIVVYSNSEALHLLFCKAITYSLKDQKALLSNLNKTIFNQLAIMQGHIQNATYDNILMLVADHYPAQLTPLLETTKAQLDHKSLPAIVSSKNNQGDTALILAAKAGNDVATRILLELGANVKARSINGNTLLHWAANNGHINIVTMLSGHGELTKEINRDGDTALHLAIKAGHAIVVDTLLLNGADIEVKNARGENVLDLAVRLHPELILPLLLKATTLNPRVQRDFLHNRLGEGYDNVLIYTASNYLNLFDPLLEVIRQYKQPLLEHILNSRNGLSETPLILAAKAGNVNATTILLDLGADIEVSNHNNRTALHAAAGEGHHNVVTLLLERGARIEAQDDSGNTALNLAVQNGHADTLNALLTSDASINSRNYNGENAFDLAIEAHAELVNHLLSKAILLTPDSQREFLLNQEEGRYRSIVAYAANTRLDLLASLFEIMQQNNIICPNVILNGRNAEGKTPLIMAAQTGRSSIVRILMQLGARVDVVDSHCHTALNHAIAEGHSDVVNLLLTTAVNTISYRHNQNENAIDIAIRLHPELIPSLLTMAITLPLRQQEEFLRNVSGGVYHSVLDYAIRAKNYSVRELLVLCGKNQHDYQVAKQQMKRFFDFDKHIQPVQAKLQEMVVKPGMKYYTAAAVAHTLISQLEQARNIYLLSEGEMNAKKATFKNSCMNAIADARPVLETHRDWGKVIGYFLLALITFPISLPLLAFGVFSLKTNSAQKLNALEKQIDEALLCPVV